MVAERPARCDMCGTALPPEVTKGRPRRFCGATCRSRARRARARAERPPRKGEAACEVEILGVRCARPARGAIVVAGRTVAVCPECAAQTLGWLSARHVPAAPADDELIAAARLPRPPEPGRPGVRPELSPREAEIVARFAEGAPTKTIAHDLAISPGTVHQYLTRARAKYAEAHRPATTRDDLYHRAVEDDIIDEPRPLDEMIRGRDKGVETALRTVYPLVLRYCRARLGTAARVFSADDVAQEVMVAIVTALPKHPYDDKTFVSFVYNVAAHKVTAYHRQAARNRAEPVPEVPDSIDTALPPEQLVLNSETREHLTTLLHGLSPRHREILLLRLVVGLSADDTAQALGLTPSAVRVAQHRALTHLRRTVTPDRLP